MNIERAICFAAEAHAGQVDKQGVPYIFHPLRVMEAVRHRGDSYARVAVLHDVVEDTKYTQHEVSDACELTAMEFVALIMVTRFEGDTYREFIQTIADNANGINHYPSAGKIARAVKIADIHDNLGRLTPELKGMEKRYAMALEILGAEL